MLAGRDAMIIPTRNTELGSPRPYALLPVGLFDGQSSSQGGWMRLDRSGCTI
jgi:hypothetical protein